MKLGFGNNTSSALASDITAAQTTIPLLPGAGALFAALLSSDLTNESSTHGIYAKVTITDAEESVFEICHLTAVAGDVLTVIRGQEKTEAIGWPFNSRIVNMATRGSENTFVQIEQLQGGDFTAATAAGTANALTISLPSTYQNNGSTDWDLKVPVLIIPTQNNTGATTVALTLGGVVVGTFPIYKGNQLELVAGDLIAGIPAICALSADKTFFQIFNPGTLLGQFLPLAGGKLSNPGNLEVGGELTADKLVTLKDPDGVASDIMLHRFMDEDGVTEKLDFYDDTGWLFAIQRNTTTGIITSVTNGPVLDDSGRTYSPGNPPPATGIVGTFDWWLGSVPPANAIVADGSQLSQTAYSKLYSIIGDGVAIANGLTADAGKFYTPDIRGRFPRGADMGAGRSGYAALFAYYNPLIGSHAHNMQFESYQADGNTDGGELVGKGTDYDLTKATDSAGGDETMPMASAFLPIIWVDNGVGLTRWWEQEEHALQRPTVWLYHETTGELVGSAPANPSPLEPGVWLTPHSATQTPPPEVQAGKVVTFRAGVWHLDDIPQEAEPESETTLSSEDIRAKNTIILHSKLRDAAGLSWVLQTSTPQPGDTEKASVLQQYADDLRDVDLLNPVWPEVPSILS